jgi:hypothetical protein
MLNQGNGAGTVTLRVTINALALVEHVSRGLGPAL